MKKLTTTQLNTVDAGLSMNLFSYSFDSKDTNTQATIAPVCYDFG